MFIRVIIILLLATNLYSQSINSIGSTNRPTGIVLKPNPCLLQKEKTTFEKILYTELAVISYGVFDYIAYNSFKNWNVEHYRFLQGIVFSSINYLLNKYVSTSSAIGFSIQVFGGVPDGVYYTIDKGFNGFNGFSNGNEFAINKYYSHLNFMPLNIGTKKVRGLDLIVNNILTTTISIAIQF